jgi:hypothetical protein
MSSLAALNIPKGYDYEQQLTVTDGDGNAINLTGCTVTFHIYAPGAASEAITPAPTLTPVTPASGIAKVVLTDTQTATLTVGTFYRYGVKILDGTGLITPPVYGLALALDIPGV